MLAKKPINLSASILKEIPPLKTLKKITKIHPPCNTTRPQIINILHAYDKKSKNPNFMH